MIDIIVGGLWLIVVVSMWRTSGPLMGLAAALLMSVGAAIVSAVRWGFRRRPRLESTPRNPKRPPFDTPS